MQGGGARGRAGVGVVGEVEDEGAARHDGHEQPRHLQQHRRHPIEGDHGASIAAGAEHSQQEVVVGGQRWDRAMAGRSGWITSSICVFASPWLLLTTRNRFGTDLSSGSKMRR
jgi:hypothetical protein